MLSMCCGQYGITKVPRSHSSCASPYYHCMRHTLGTAPAHVTPSFITCHSQRNAASVTRRIIEGCISNFRPPFVACVCLTGKGEVSHSVRTKYGPLESTECWSQPKSLLSACCLMLQAHQNCNATSAATPNSVQTAGLALLQQLRQCCCFFQPHSWPSVGHSGSPVGAWQELLASPFCCC